MLYVALLRGINVGGNNIIKMSALKEAFEHLGYSEVVTYIASGNVLFVSPSRSRPALTRAIESALAKTFAYESKIVLVSSKELAEVVAEAPRGFGREPTKYRYDVLFVKPPFTAKKALADIPVAPGIDDVAAGSHALYFRRLVAKATQSKLPKIMGLPLYKSLTVRTWNTTTKLLALAEG